MLNDNIKVKKHSEYTPPLDNNLSITMNSIKKIHQVGTKFKYLVFKIYYYKWMISHFNY